MIRLYIDKSFEVGEPVKLPETELRYLKSVRRGQGEIEIFNRQGQIAHGTLKKTEFYIEKVFHVEVPVYPITVAVGLPENSVIPSIIRSLSELGIAELLFFNATRSQKAADRLKKMDSRWERLALESMRQCARGVPLEIKMGDWRAVDGFKHRWFCDESSGSDLGSIRLFSAEKILIVIGCEGGWTEKEREEARDLQFTFAHFKTPILRVETAATCAGFMGVQAYADALP